MFRKPVLTIIGLLFVLGVLIACAPAPTAVEQKAPPAPEEEKAAEKEMPEAAAEEQLAAEQVARVLMRGKKSVISPNREGGLGRNWIRVVWLSPLELQADGSVTPSLAQEIDISEDGLEYTLHLDPKAVFSNGKPITAKAVKESWEWGARVENLPTWGGVYLILKYVEGMDTVNKGESDDASGLVVVDDHTLKIKLTGRVHGFREMLASYMLGVFDASDEVDNVDYWRRPAVSGPYQIEWDPDTGAVDLTPNPRWWGEQPTLERAEFRVVEDAQARLIAYENNEADILKDTGALLGQLLATHKDEMVRIPGLGLFYLGVNNQLEPTDDVHVRRALLFAIDRHNVIKSLFPTHKPIDNLLGENFLCHNPTLKIPYDPELAREELAKSRYGGPENLPPIKLEYWADIEFWGRILTAFQQQWEENLGVKVELYGVDSYDQENFNLHRLSGGSGVRDPSDFLSRYALPDGSYAAYQRLQPPEYLAEWQREADAMSHEDMTEPCKLYNKIERALILEEAVVWPMIDVPYHWVVKPWIKNFKTTLNQDINWDEIVVLAH